MEMYGDEENKSDRNSLSNKDDSAAISYQMPAKLLLLDYNPAQKQNEQNSFESHQKVKPDVLNQTDTVS